MPTYTRPGPCPSTGSGPATPVRPTPQVAVQVARMPSASAAAVSGLTGPWQARSSSGTPARTALRSVAYTTAPPRSVALAPGTEAIVAQNSPAVSDSAAATVSPRPSSAACTRAATGSGVGAGVGAGVVTRRCR